MPNIELVVCDMAGTTVRDEGEVLACFMAAARRTGLGTDEDAVRSMMGQSKREVFVELAARHTGSPGHDADALANRAYDCFRSVLEEHYRARPVQPVDGTDALFEGLRTQGIRIALTTGFYRKVTDIILGRLGWLEGLDERRVNTGPCPFDASICSDDVPTGRPAPYMIHEAMRRLGVHDIHAVAKVGDTPADLRAGHHAGCAMNVGVLSGTGTREQLASCPHTHMVERAHEILTLI